MTASFCFASICQESVFPSLNESIAKFMSAVRSSIHWEVTSKTSASEASLVPIVMESLRNFLSAIMVFPDES